MVDTMKFITGEDLTLLAALMVTIGGLVRTTKADIPFLPTIPAKFRPLLALLLGAAGGALDALVRGTPPVKALLVGVSSAIGAMIGHQTLVEGMRNGVEFGAKKDPSPEEDAAKAVDAADEVPPTSSEKEQDK